MDNFEKVEKLRERANVSYEEAKAALEASNWDLLDAMIYLEKSGKTEAAGTYSTSADNGGYNMDQAYTRDNTYNTNYTERKSGTFGEKVKALLKKSDENHFRVTKRDGSKLIEVPIWLAIIITLTLFEFVLIFFNHFIKIWFI